MSRSKNKFQSFHNYKEIKTHQEVDQEEVKEKDNNLKKNKMQEKQK